MQRFHSDVVTLSARRADEDRFTVVPIEAADAISAARQIAEIAARRRYGDDGSVGYVSPAALVHNMQDGFYRATIGVQHPANDGIMLRGVTISIHVWPAEAQADTVAAGFNKVVGAKWFRGRT
jgi:hypothetical protein